MSDAPRLEDGVFYDLDPPSVIQGNTYRRAKCEYQVPKYPNEYVMLGIPEGQETPKSFILRFTPNGRKMTAIRSQNQE